MLVKTFQAHDMSEALKMVKSELGPEAMIISSKKTKSKGVMGLFGRPVVEITAALDREPRHRNPYREPEREEREERELTTREAFRNSMLEPIAREVKDMRDKLEVLMRREQEKPQRSEPVEMKFVAEPEPVLQPVIAAERPFVPPTIPREELEELKQLLFDAVGKREVAAAPQPLSQADAAAEFVEERLSRRIVAPEDPMVELESKLVVAGVEQEAIDNLLDLVAPYAENGEGLEKLQGRLKEAMGKVIKCAGPLRLRKGTPRVLALVGPTGVGKTTTIAKLAAMYTLEKGARVALITVDNFRVGAVEQLKTYARIMGLELETAATAQELERAIDRHHDKELILIDTAGRSHRDREKLEELRGVLNTGSAIEVHLCIAATTRDREMREIADRFGVLGVKKILYTKLDESECFGSLVNLQMSDRYPISYFTDGQRVPEDIETASAARLAELVLGESDK